MGEVKSLNSALAVDEGTLKGRERRKILSVEELEELEELEDEENGRREGGEE
jgi:hypothetical protein